MDWIFRIMELGGVGNFGVKRGYLADVNCGWWANRIAFAGEWIW